MHPSSLIRPLPGILLLALAPPALAAVTLTAISRTMLSIDPDQGQVLQVQVQGATNQAERAVRWEVRGGGRILPNPLSSRQEGLASCTYRPPRAGGNSATVEAISVQDPTQRVVFNVFVDPLRETPPPLAVDLTPHLTHTGEEYHQGGCTNCYAWAANTALEVAMATRYGIRDRLSVQYFNMALAQERGPGGQPLDPCHYQAYSLVYDTYQRLGKLIPWSNPHAAYQDPSRASAARQVGLFPFYRLNRIHSPGINLSLWSQEEAIAELKHRLSQGDAVIYLRHSHYTVLLGYDAQDPDPAKHHWKVLDSLHRSGGRPDPTWHLPMRSLTYDPGEAPSGEAYFYYVADLDLELPPAGPPTCELAGPRLRDGLLQLKPGERLELEATVQGRPPMTYQWLRNGQELAGQTRSVLEIPALTETDAGAYAVRVRSGTHQATSPPATLAFPRPASSRSLTALPAALTLPAGATRRVRALVEGLRDSQVTWTLEGSGTLSSREGNPVKYTAAVHPRGPATLQAQSVEDPTLVFTVPILVKSMDLNGDGRVDVLDLGVLAQAFGSSRGDARYLEAADLNDTGKVDGADVQDFLSAWDAQP